MARPASGKPRKIKLNLTVPADVRMMAEAVANAESISISEYLENHVRKDFKALRRKGKVQDVDVNQMTISDMIK